jgi:hypothetical protein
VLANAKKLKELDSAGTTAKDMISINTDGQVKLAPDGVQVKI